MASAVIPNLSADGYTRFNDENINLSRTLCSDGKSFFLQNQGASAKSLAGELNRMEPRSQAPQLGSVTCQKFDNLFRSFFY